MLIHLYRTFFIQLLLLHVHMFSSLSSMLADYVWLRYIYLCPEKWMIFLGETWGWQDTNQNPLSSVWFHNHTISCANAAHLSLILSNHTTNVLEEGSLVCACVYVCVGSLSGDHLHIKCRHKFPFFLINSELGLYTVRSFEVNLLITRSVSVYVSTIQSSLISWKFNSFGAYKSYLDIRFFLYILQYCQS